MARKPAMYLPADDVTDVFDTEETVEAPRTDAEEKTDAIADALKDDPDAFVNVTRQTTNGRSPMEFIGRFPADKYDYGQLLDYLSSNFGGGDYRIMLYSKGRVRANKLVSIAEQPRKNALSSPIGEAAGILGTVLDRMEKQNQMMVEMLQKQNAPPDRMGFLNEMMLMKQLFDTDKSSGSGIGQLKEALEALQLLGVEIGGKKDDEDSGFTGLLKSFAPVVEAAVTVNAQQARAAYKPNPIPPRETDMLFPLIKSAVASALKGAARDSDPGVYATMMIDTFGEENARKVLLDERILEKLIKLEPRISAYRAWFDDLIEHAKASFGLESRFADLYYADLPAEIDGDITGEILDTVADDQTNLSTASDT